MLEMRNITSEEFIEWVRVEARAYGNRLDHDPELLRPHFDLDRSIAVFDQGDIVGGAHSHRVQMSVPGGSTFVAGVANVEVQPTHRRQGIMTMMMRHQINDVYERGEPMTALFASESIIYGRFGYGVASMYERWEIDRQHTAYVQPYDSPGRISFVEPEDIAGEFAGVFKRAINDRPGVFESAALVRWEREARAPELTQGGRGGLFFIVYRAEGTTDGYAIYRTSGNRVVVTELIAATREANTALWRFCFDVDLMHSTEALRRPVDDPLPWMLADPRRLQRSPRDGMWLRLVDVAASLGLRNYMESGRLVMGVSDGLCPWNDQAFELEGSPEGSDCRPTNSAPDLVLGVSNLAAAYLGAVGFTTLSRAGLVEERTPGALLRADRMFSVQNQAWTPHGF